MVFDIAETRRVGDRGGGEELYSAEDAFWQKEAEHVCHPVCFSPAQLLSVVIVNILMVFQYETLWICESRRKGKGET
jgi:hypothetical protein